MADQGTAVSSLFRTWVSEFARAVEMFSGEQAAIDLTNGAGGEQPGSLLWWKQVFVVEESNATEKGSVWIGAPEATWSALGGSLGTDAAEACNTYTEMLTQSLTGTAVVLSKESQNKVTCGEGVAEANSPSLAGCDLVSLVVKLKEKELPGIIAAIESSFAKHLAALLAAPPATAPAVEQSVRGPNLIPLLDRVIDLDLPFSVVLGHATLPIRRVLQLTAGSLIELDHYVDQPVELRVQGAIVANCEVVTVGGNYGIRILEIVSPEERMNLRNLTKKAKVAAR